MKISVGYIRICPLGPIPGVNFVLLDHLESLRKRSWWDLDLNFSTFPFKKAGLVVEILCHHVRFEYIASFMGNFCKTFVATSLNPPLTLINVSKTRSHGSTHCKDFCGGSISLDLHWKHELSPHLFKNEAEVNGIVDRISHGVDFVFALPRPT